jgi:hypothetical protein
MNNTTILAKICIFSLIACTSILSQDISKITRENSSQHNEIPGVASLDKIILKTVPLIVIPAGIVFTILHYNVQENNILQSLLYGACNGAISPVFAWNTIITKSASLTYFLLSAHTAKKSYQFGAGIFTSVMRGMFSPIYAILSAAKFLEDKVLVSKSARKKENHSAKTNRPQSQSKIVVQNNKTFGQKESVYTRNRSHSF